MGQDRLIEAGRDGRHARRGAHQGEGLEHERTGRCWPRTSELAGQGRAEGGGVATVAATPRDDVGQRVRSGRDGLGRALGMEPQEVGHHRGAQAG